MADNEVTIRLTADQVELISAARESRKEVEGIGEGAHHASLGFEALHETAHLFHIRMGHVLGAATALGVAFQAAHHLGDAMFEAWTRKAERAEKAVEDYRAASQEAAPTAQNPAAVDRALLTLETPATPDERAKLFADVSRAGRGQLRDTQALEITQAAGFAQRLGVDMKAFTELAATLARTHVSGNAGDTALALLRANPGRGAEIASAATKQADELRGIGGDQLLKILLPSLNLKQGTVIPAQAAYEGFTRGLSPTQAKAEQEHAEQVEFTQKAARNANGQGEDIGLAHAAAKGAGILLKAAAGFAPDKTPVGQAERDRVQEFHAFVERERSGGYRADLKADEADVINRLLDVLAIRAQRQERGELKYLPPEPRTSDSKPAAVAPAAEVHVDVDHDALGRAVGNAIKNAPPGARK